MEVKPYTLPGVKLLDQFRRKVEALLPQWSESWALQLRLQRVFNPDQEPALTQQRQTAAAIRFDAENSNDWVVVEAAPQMPANLGAKVMRQSFALPQANSSSPFLDQLGRQLLAELIGKLTTREALDWRSKNGSLETCLATPGRQQDARYALLEMTIDDEPLAIWLPWSIAELFVEDYIEQQLRSVQPKSLTKKLRAIGDLGIPAQAVLGTADLSLDTLSSLSIGDVICLDKSINDSLTLSFSGTASGFAGFLGQRDQHLAIKIEKFISPRKVSSQTPN